MSEQTYAAMRAFIGVTVELEVKKLAAELRSSIPTETREPNIDDIERRVWEKIVPKIPAAPVIVQPKDGKDGADGKNGTDGIATREELESIIEERMAEVRVRSFADMYQGVYQPDKDYTRSALVTWGGSLFLALANTRARPEQSPDWKLIVKRGADGKR